MLPEAVLSGSIIFRISVDVVDALIKKSLIS